MESTEAIIEKIKKAIRLANKTTEEGERETAMRLAKNLAEKNGIAFEDVAQDTRDTGKQSQVTTEWERTRGAIDGHACVILREHFGVVVMMWSRSNLRKFTYFGNSLNIEIAKYVFDILRRESQKAWDEVKDEYKTLGFKLNKTSFLDGWFFRIHKKLTEHPLRNDLDAEREAAEKAFKKYEEEQDEPIKESKTAHRKHDDDASLYHGYMIADRVSLNRPCDCSNTEPSKQIGKQEYIGIK